jgi:hypothetical protein
MTSTEPGARRALLVAMMDLPREFEDELNLWYDYDHIPERLSCEGITGCERLELHPVEPAGWTPAQRWTKYMHVYSLASIEVLDSPAYGLQKVMNEGKGSVWRQVRTRRQKAAQPPKGRSLRTSFVERAVPWHAPAAAMPEPHVYLVQMRHDAGDRDEAVNDFVDRQLAPELLSLPGFVGCRRYEAPAKALAKSSPAKSSPAKSSPAKSSAAKGLFRHPKYFDVFELTTPEVLTSGIFRRFVASLASFDAEIVQAWTPAGSGVYFQRPSPWRLRLRERRDDYI